MPFQQGNKLGTHGNHKSNFNPQQFSGTRWMQKDAEVRRVTQEESIVLLSEGWMFGRPVLSAEIKQKLSESHKRSPNRRTYWKPGHPAWNLGDKMSEDARISMSIGKLAKYGVTRQQVIDARASNMAWCSEHLIFEPEDSFATIKNGVRATRCRNSHKKYSPWYRETFLKQQGVCAICAQPEPRMVALSVDHRHDCQNEKHTRKSDPLLGCECSRGLLCSLCNPRLGYFEQIFGNIDPTILPTVGSMFVQGSWEAKALQYLSSYSDLP